MKLYATVTSERATKGQGGAELVMDLFDENSLQVSSIMVLPRESGKLDGKVRIFLRTKASQAEVFDEYVLKTSQFFDKPVQQKGEKQKAECSECITKNGWPAYCEKHAYNK